MTHIALLRHGVTEWNSLGRVQGRTDIEISPQSRAWFATRALPIRYKSWRVFTSPLIRAQQTAEALCLKAPVLASSIAEMSWGEWEGQTLQALRSRYGAEFEDLEALGLDFLPPGGESPRMVQRRASHWLREIHKAGRDAVVVTHKGVMRALLALAWDWDLTGRSPHRIDWLCLQVLTINDNGALSVEVMNQSLDRR